MTLRSPAYLDGQLAEPFDGWQFQHIERETQLIDLAAAEVNLEVRFVEAQTDRPLRALA